MIVVFSVVFIASLKLPELTKTVLSALTAPAASTQTSSRTAAAKNTRFRFVGRTVPLSFLAMIKPPQDQQAASQRNRGCNHELNPCKIVYGNNNNIIIFISYHNINSNTDIHSNHYIFKKPAIPTKNNITLYRPHTSPALPKPLYPLKQHLTPNNYDHHEDSRWRPRSRRV